MKDTIANKRLLGIGCILFVLLFCCFSVGAVSGRVQTVEVVKEVPVEKIVYQDREINSREGENAIHNQKILLQIIDRKNEGLQIAGEILGNFEYYIEFPDKLDAKTERLTQLSSEIKILESQLKI